MQTIAQCNVYRYTEGQYQFLLLKRIDERKHFWQPVTEAQAGSEDIGITLKRGLHAQIGVDHVKHLSQETYSYEWYTGGQRGRDIVFAIEIHSKTEVVLDKTRYLEYQWLSYDDALDMVKWSGNKESLRRLMKRLESEPRVPEIELNTHEAPAGTGYSAAGNAPVNASTATQQGNFVSQVRHDQLPELPEDKDKEFGLL
jgi:hypothetical protein